MCSVCKLLFSLCVVYVSYCLCRLCVVYVSLCTVLCSTVNVCVVYVSYCLCRLCSACKLLFM